VRRSRLGWSHLRRPPGTAHHPDYHNLRRRAPNSASCPMRGHYILRPRARFSHPEQGGLRARDNRHGQKPKAGRPGEAGARASRPPTGPGIAGRAPPFRTGKRWSYKPGRTTGYGAQFFKQTPPRPSPFPAGSSRRPGHVDTTHRGGARSPPATPSGAWCRATAGMAPSKRDLQKLRPAPAQGWAWPAGSSTRGIFWTGEEGWFPRPAFFFFVQQATAGHPPPRAPAPTIPNGVTTNTNFTHFLQPRTSRAGDRENEQRETRRQPDHHPRQTCCQTTGHQRAEQGKAFAAQRSPLVGSSRDVLSGFRRQIRCVLRPDSTIKRVELHTETTKIRPRGQPFRYGLYRRGRQWRTSGSASGFIGLQLSNPVCGGNGRPSSNSRRRRPPFPAIAGDTHRTWSPRSAATAGRRTSGAATGRAFPRVRSRGGC